MNVKILSTAAVVVLLCAALAVVLFVLPRENRECRGRRAPAEREPRLRRPRDPAALPADPDMPERLSYDSQPFEHRVMVYNASPEVMDVAGVRKPGLRKRTESLRKLTTNLGGDDVKVLRLFLEQPASEQEAMRPLEFNALKNNVADVLLRQDELPDGLGLQLVEMYRDRDMDVVWRDYCVQYLAPYYNRKWPPGTADAPETGGSAAETDAERAEILRAYREALGEKDSTIAGTALLAVERLSRRRPEFDREEIGRIAVELACDEACAGASRITALRVSALMGRKEVLSGARIAAQTGETSTLRLAAIATLGDIGEGADRELLESLSAGGEDRIAAMAASALSRLKRRP
ncbi:MAG: hypothetical protein R6V03_05940 [Kiritimatiellia bacterium]